MGWAWQSFRDGWAFWCGGSQILPFPVQQQGAKRRLQNLSLWVGEELFSLFSRIILSSTPQLQIFSFNFWEAFSALKAQHPWHSGSRGEARTWGRMASWRVLKCLCSFSLSWFAPLGAQSHAPTCGVCLRPVVVVVARPPLAPRLPSPLGRHFVLSPQHRIRLSLCVSVYASPWKCALSEVLIKPMHLKGCTVLCVCCTTTSFVWVGGKGWSAHLLYLTLFSIFQYYGHSSVIPVECYFLMFGLK